MRVSLQVTLAAHFSLRSFCEKWRVLPYFGQLVTIRSFLHDRMAVNASDAATGMWARLPICLHAALVAAETGFVLSRRGFTRVLAERDHATDALAPSGSNMVAAGAVTALASPLLCFVARVIEKNLSHLSLGKFFKLDGVASLANFVTHVGGRSGLGGFFFC